MPILVPLDPRGPGGDVLEVALPLTEIGERLVADERDDAVWWADRTSGTLLASPRSRYIGDDLRQTAGLCRDGLDALLGLHAPVSGTAGYCWPQAHGGVAERLAGFSGRDFLGLKTVVGVSVQRERALATLRSSQRTLRAIVGAVVLSMLILLGVTVIGSKGRLLRERKGALASLSALSQALEARDGYTRFHSENVGAYSAELGRRLGLSVATQDDLQLAGRMHDLGKIGICDGILTKPGPLDKGERASMERHTLIGEEILGHLPWADQLAEVACCHHERMDGTGYPRQLRGARIPHHARIVAVADVFDALLTDRPYRDAMPLDRALAIIQEMAGSHLDPDVVQALQDDPEAMLDLGGGPRPAATEGIVTRPPAA